MKQIDYKSLAHDAMLIVGMSILLVFAVLPLFKIKGTIISFAYAFGAVLVLAARLVEQYRGKDMRVRRLYTLNKISAVLFCISAGVVFFPISGPNDWLTFLLAGAVVQIYVSLVIDKALRNEKKD